MGTKRKKMMELTIEMKKEVLDLLDKGDSQRKIAAAFSVAKSTVGNIGKNRIEILRAWNENGSRERKRKLRKTENEELNNLVFEFFCKCRSIHIPVSGPMLQSKAKEIAEKLGIDKFKASNGWLESFRRRNNNYFGIPTTSEDILESNLQQKEHSDAECHDSDKDEIVNDSTPVPTHKEALQHLAQLLRYFSIHQPQRMDSLFEMQSNIEEHLFSAAVTKQMKISDFFANSKE